jgi:methyl-accepting chemotaxis protein
MANVKTLPVIGDTGSQDVAQLVKNFNALVDVLGTMITSMKSSAGFVADLQTIATTAETALVATVDKLKLQPNTPLAPGMKAV